MTANASEIFRLTREVRFAINAPPEPASVAAPTNTFAGFPTLTGLGHFFTLQATLQGRLDVTSQYLRNIKDIDEVIRRRAVATVTRAVHAQSPGFNLPVLLMADLKNAWPGTRLAAIRLNLSPFLSIACFAQEQPMVRLSQRFEFSASHRLHNDSLSDEENRRLFGKCNNPLGHGHNYELQVTLIGEINGEGILIGITEFERIVTEAVIDKLDHRNLNVEVAEFAGVIPSVENIARVIFGLLKGKFGAGVRVGSVTVWETSRTWCEYGG